MVLLTMLAEKISPMLGEISHRETLEGRPWLFLLGLNLNAEPLGPMWKS